MPLLGETVPLRYERRVLKYLHMDENHGDYLNVKYTFVFKSTNNTNSPSESATVVTDVLVQCKTSTSSHVFWDTFDLLSRRG